MVCEVRWGREGWFRLTGLGLVVDSVRVLSPSGPRPGSDRVGRASTADARFRGRVPDLAGQKTLPKLGREIGAGNSSSLKVKELKLGR